MTNLPKTETLGTAKAALWDDRSSMDAMTLQLSDRDVAHEAATTELSKTRQLDTVPGFSFLREIGETQTASIFLPLGSPAPLT